MLQPVPSLRLVIPEIVNLTNPIGKDTISLNEIFGINRTIIAECERPIFKFWYQRSPGAAKVMSYWRNDKHVWQTYLTILTRYPGFRYVLFSSSLKYRSIIWGPLLYVTSNHITISLGSRDQSFPTVMCTFGGPFNEKRIIEINHFPFKRNVLPKLRVMLSSLLNIRPQKTIPSSRNTQRMTTGTVASVRILFLFGTPTDPERSRTPKRQFYGERPENRIDRCQWYSRVPGCRSRAHPGLPTRGCSSVGQGLSSHAPGVVPHMASRAGTMVYRPGSRGRHGLKAFLLWRTDRRTWNRSQIERTAGPGAAQVSHGIGSFRHR